MWNIFNASIIMVENPQIRKLFLIHVDIRRWSAITWNTVFWDQLYKMANSRFLFEFPNRNITEQIIQREWRWEIREIATMTVKLVT